MTAAPSPGPSVAKRRRPRAAAAVERQLLDEVLELKDQVGHLALAIERQTNAMAQSELLATRDLKGVGDKLEAIASRLIKIEAWQSGIEQERAEQRGAARVRKSLLAIVAGSGAIFGSGVGVFLNWLLRGGS